MAEEIMDLENENEGSIDFVNFAKTIWKGRKTIIICIIIGSILGFFIAISTPKQYTATTVMAPQLGSTSNSKGSQLSGLAALAGINVDIMSQQGSEISPILYPQIINSIPFKLELMNTLVKFEDFDKPISLFDYYTNAKYQKVSILGTLKKYTIGLPGVIIKAIKGKPEQQKNFGSIANQLIQLNQEQFNVLQILDDAVNLDVAVKEGYLTLTVIMPEPLAAAQIAQNAQQLLRRYITNFKVQKAKADLEFIQGRYDEVKAQAEGFQYNIAVKSDQYKDLTSNIPQVESSRIQTKFGIANSVFQDLAKQLEQAKIQVKKDTPVFIIVEPVTIPFEKSKPNRPMIFFVWIFLGGIMGVSLILSKGFLADLKKKWKE